MAFHEVIGFRCTARDETEAVAGDFGGRPIDAGTKGAGRMDWPLWMTRIARLVLDI